MRAPVIGIAKWRLGIILLAASIFASSIGCNLLPGGPAATPTPPARTEKPSLRPTAVVKRGSIVESIKVLARVTAVREAEMYFKNPGKLKKMTVQVGQEVSEGQVLAELDTGDLEARIATAQANYDVAKVKLDKLKGNREDAEIRRKLELANAALAVQQASAALAKAEIDLAVVKVGPTPVETAEAAVRDAQANLDSARRNLDATRVSTVVAKNVRDRENEANWYEANYGTYLDKFNRGEITKDEVDGHWANLVAAKERLQAARIEAAGALAKAEAQVTQAEEALRKAQAELQVKMTFPPDSHIIQAEQSVETARLTLEKVRLEYAQKQAGTEDYEVTLQEKAVEQAAATLIELQAQLADSRLLAPFAGKVMIARGRVGDQVAALQSVASIADPGDLQVRGDIIDADVPKIALGQEVNVTIDSLPGTTLKGTVASIPGNFTSQGGNVLDRSVQVKVDWQARTPQLGTLARVSITVQKRDDVLIVPVKAVKTVGKRQFVEYMEGSIRRSANVQVGVVTDTEAEIVDGLTDGQVILSGQ